MSGLTKPSLWETGKIICKDGKIKAEREHAKFAHKSQIKLRSRKKNSAQGKKRNVWGKGPRRAQEKKKKRRSGP